MFRKGNTQHSYIPVQITTDNFKVPNLHLLYYNLSDEAQNQGLLQNLLIIAEAEH